MHRATLRRKPLRLRFATAADAALLATLNAQLISEGADFGPREMATLEGRMRNWIVGGPERAVLFEDARRRVVGYAVYREDADEVYLRQFLVLRSVRECGTGREAFELLRRRLWSPRKRLTLDVLIGNRNAYRFWRSLGYRDCAMTMDIPPSKLLLTPTARLAAPPLTSLAEVGSQRDRGVIYGFLMFAAALRSRFFMACRR